MNVKSFIGKNIVVYDLEIKEVIDGRLVTWKSFDKMGISVGCAFDYRENRFRVFLDDNIQQLVDRLNEEGTIVSGFNHVDFDNNLLRGMGFNLKPDSELLNYDLLRVSRKGAGVEKYCKGFKLQEHLIELGLPLKTDSGAHAPILWREKKLGELVDYCLNDVTQELALFDYFQMHGHSKCAYKKQAYRVENIFEHLKL